MLHLSRAQLAEAICAKLIRDTPEMPTASFQTPKVLHGHALVVWVERIVHTLLTEMMNHVNGQLHESCLKEQPVKEHPLILEMAVFQPDLTFRKPAFGREK